MFDLKNSSKSTILAKIYEFKHNNFNKVTINRNFNNLKYEIMLLTSECANNQHLLEIIGRWRKENEMWFLSQFPVTVERTTRWFKERVIGAPDRLLFMIKVHKDYIGHVGLYRFEFENNTCEIDNIVRGEPEYPGIMEDAVRNMMKWGRDVLGLKGYSLKVLSNNERAIKFYRRLGFCEVGRIPLTYIKGDRGLELVEALDTEDDKAERYYVLMRLSDNINKSEEMQK